MGKASRRKASNRSLDLLGRAMNVIQKATGTKEFRVRNNELPQEEKISNALATLLQAAVQEGSPLDEYRAALDFIVLAWNISLMNDNDRSEALGLVAAKYGGDDDQARETLNLIEGLIVKKQAMFPDDKRHVVSWEASWQGDYLRVSATALVPPV